MDEKRERCMRNQPLYLNYPPPPTLFVYLFCLFFFIRMRLLGASLCKFVRSIGRVVKAGSLEFFVFFFMVGGVCYSGFWFQCLLVP